MSDEPEFRVGDVAGAPPQARRAPGTARLDTEVFPTLAAFVDADDFRERLDELAGQARQARDTQVQSALKTAVRLLPVLQGKFGRVKR